jgi:hypothetical protein
MIFLELLAAYLGHRRWGGWRGAAQGVLVLWLVYLLVCVPAVVVLIFLGGQVSTILEVPQ